MDEEIERCPFCGDGFGLIELTEHAPMCETRSLAFLQSSSSSRAPAPSKSVVCGVCKKECLLDELFILDECSCKFHRKCVEQQLLALVAVSVNVQCSVCSKEVSMRDLAELTGAKQRHASAPSQDASSRLISELSLIKKAGAEKSGFSAAPVKKNLFLWEVKLFGFEGEKKRHINEKGC